jgi:hypothetical protein
MIEPRVFLSTPVGVVVVTFDLLPLLQPDLHTRLLGFMGSCGFCRQRLDYSLWAENSTEARAAHHAHNPCPVVVDFHRRVAEYRAQTAKRLTSPGVLP